MHRQLSELNCTYFEQFEHVVELPMNIANQNDRRVDHHNIGLTHQHLLNLSA